MLSELFEPGARIESMGEPQPIPGRDEPALHAVAMLTCEGEPESCLIEAALTNGGLAGLRDRDPADALRELLIRRAMGFPNDGFRVANMTVYSPHAFDSVDIGD